VFNDIFPKFCWLVTNTYEVHVFLFIYLFIYLMLYYYTKKVTILKKKCKSCLHTQQSYIIVQFKAKVQKYVWITWIVHVEIRSHRFIKQKEDERNINLTRVCRSHTETNKTKEENWLGEILPLLIKLFQLFVF